MLQITVVTSESYDETTQKFIANGVDLELEHSLASLSKWESHFRKPFLSKEDKTAEETLWYIEAMIRTPNVPPGIVAKFSEKNFQQINDYINAPHTATTFRDDPNQKPSREIMTAELFYHIMFTLHIPIEFEHRNLNQLLTLIRVTNIKNSPPKKMSPRQLMERNRALNEARQKELGTRG